MVSNSPNDPLHASDVLRSVLPASARDVKTHLTPGNKQTKKGWHEQTSMNMVNNVKYKNICTGAVRSTVGDVFNSAACLGRQGISQCRVRLKDGQDVLDTV